MKIARDSLALLRRRDFTFLMGAQWLAQAADGLVGVSLAKHIAFGGQAGFSLEEARTPEEVLRIAILTILPYAFLSPFAGVLIDRWDRRRLLLLANGVRALVLAVVVAAGFERIGDPALYGSFLLVLASTRLLLAVKGASLPVVLGERDLLHGNSISQAGSAIFQLGGAGVGLVGSGFVGTPVLVLAGVAVYGLATASAAAIGRLGYGQRTVPLRDEIGRIVRDLFEGLREIRRHPMAALSLTSFLGLRALVSLVVLAVALASRPYLAREGSLTTAIPAAAGALGAAVGFFSAHALKDRVPPVRILVAALAFAGLGVLAFGGIITLPGLSAVAFTVGLGFFLGKIAVDTLIQQSLADAFRGRGFGLQDLAYNLSWIIPALILWAAWTQGSVRPVLVGAGLVFLASAAGIALWARRIGAPREPASPPEDPSR
ncbi:MAG: MFS transporter [Actinomycetota bacterium]